MKRRVLVFGGILALALNVVVFFTPIAIAKDASSVNTAQSIKGAKWNPTVKITYSKDSVILQPTGIPNHSRDIYYAVPMAGVMVPNSSTASVTKDPTKVQIYKFTIPTTPKYSTIVTKTSLGSIGVMISGAVLFNAYEGDGKTVAMSSNFSITDASGATASFVDKCSGHPTPNSGAYHYHGLPSCVTSKVDTSTGASHIIGYALDGYPIYGSKDIQGKIVPVKSLDKCNGITSPTPEFPQGIYHYVLPGTSDATSSIGCFHGVVDTSQVAAAPQMRNGPPAPPK